MQVLFNTALKSTITMSRGRGSAWRTPVQLRMSPAHLSFLGLYHSGCATCSFKSLTMRLINRCLTWPTEAVTQRFNCGLQIHSPCHSGAELVDL